MKIISIQTGKKKEYKKNKKSFESSFIKNTASLPQEVGKEGFVLDTQSDRVHHGGESKAIMAFAYENYKFFEDLLNIEKIPNYGENITISGLNEESVSVGSVYKIGKILLEVSQPREPCWKVSYFLNHKEGTKAMFKSGKTGWYFRVLKGGVLREDDTISLVERKNKDLTIANLNSLLNRKLNDKELLKKAIDCPALGEPFRKSLRKI